jgi:hypothetical protein
MEWTEHGQTSVWFWNRQNILFGKIENKKVKGHFCCCLQFGSTFYLAWSFSRELFSIEIGAKPPGEDYQWINWKEGSFPPIFLSISGNLPSVINARCWEKRKNKQYVSMRQHLKSNSWNLQLIFIFSLWKIPS